MPTKIQMKNERKFNGVLAQGKSDPSFVKC